MLFHAEVIHCDCWPPGMILTAMFGGVVMCSSSAHHLLICEFRVALDLITFWIVTHRCVLTIHQSTQFTISLSLFRTSGRWMARQRSATALAPIDMGNRGCERGQRRDPSNLTSVGKLCAWLRSNAKMHPTPSPSSRVCWFWHSIRSAARCIARRTLQVARRVTSSEQVHSPRAAVVQPVLWSAEVGGHIWEVRPCRRQFMRLLRTRRSHSDPKEIPSSHTARAHGFF